MSEHEDAVAYAFCNVISPKAQKVEMFFGSGDGAKVWVNGELAHKFVGDRALKLDQDTFVAELKAGLNRCLVKVDNGKGEWGFAIRMLSFEDYLRSVKNALDISVERQFQDEREQLIINVRRVSTRSTQTWILPPLRTLDVFVVDEKGKRLAQLQGEEGEAILWPLPRTIKGNISVLAEGTDDSGRTWRGHVANLAFPTFSTSCFGHWRQYTFADGLPEDVRTILQDKDGTLWLGMQMAGVCRFDGISFEHFDDDAINVASPVPEFQAKDGSIWFAAAYGGLARYDGQAFYKFTGKDGFGGWAATAIEDKSGIIWVGGYMPGRLWQYDGNTFKHFGVADGLPGNRVYHLCEDKQGRIWVGTPGGLALYDKGSIRSFTDNELPHNEIYAILQDKKEAIWIGTECGLCQYDGKTWRTFTQKDGLLYNRVRLLFEDDAGNLWIGGIGGVSRFDGTGFQNFVLGAKTIRNIIEDIEGYLWISVFSYRFEDYKLFRFDGKKFDRLMLDENNSRTYTIRKDYEGNLWFGTGNGLVQFDPKTFQNFTEANGLPGKRIQEIKQDSQGNLWLYAADTKKLCKYDGHRFHTFTENEPFQGRLLLEDSKGNLWFAHADEGDVRRFDGKKIREFTEKDGYAGRGALCAFEDRQGNIWFGPDGGGIIKYDGIRFQRLTEADSEIIYPVFCAYQDTQGHIWFGLKGGGAVRYDGKEFRLFTYKDGFWGQRVHVITEDDKGNLWFASWGGLFKYDGQKFERFDIGTSWSTLKDKAGNLWCGTFGRSLVRYDGNSLRRFTREDGLAQESVEVIAEAPDGKIWFGTRGGVSIYDGQVFQTITAEDGLVNNDVYAIVFDRDGSVWFGTKGGLSHYTPNKVPPLMYITKVIADKSYAQPKTLELSSSANNLSFFYKGVSLKTRSGQLRYLYQLKGYDADWQNPTREQRRDYRDLKPGRYTFRVKAIDRDLNYSEPASLHITISLPFYMKAVFLVPTVSLGVILLATLIILATAFVKHRRRISAYQRLAVQELQDANRVQMSLMPETAPEIEGVEIAGKCIPANTVSGDFFDYLEGKHQNEITLVVADVTGKAMKGAMNAVMTDGILRATAMEQIEFTPASLMMTLNNVLKVRMERNMNVTMVIGVIHRNRVFGKKKATKGHSVSEGEITLTLANAGHHALPILLRDGETQPLEAVGLPLGMMAGIEYEEKQFQLQSGDVLIFMTDGIIEAMDSEERYYSDSGRLEETISQLTLDMSAEAMVEAVIADAIDFGGDRESRDDDMTVVVAKIQ